jgi:hypothetical protein
VNVELTTGQQSDWMSSCTAQAVHVPSLTRATAAKPRPVFLQITRNMDGTAPIRPMVATSRAIASSLSSMVACKAPKTGFKILPLSARYFLFDAALNCTGQNARAKGSKMGVCLQASATVIFWIA